MKTFNSFLLEKRSNPDLNRIDMSPIQYVNSLYTQYDYSDIYLTFTGLSKLGLNPINQYNTPTGIYSYKLSHYIKAIVNDGSFRDIPYQANTPYIIFFKKKANSYPLLVIGQYDHFDHDIKLLKDKYEDQLNVLMNQDQNSDDELIKEIEQKIKFITDNFINDNSFDNNKEDTFYKTKDIIDRYKTDDLEYSKWYSIEQELLNEFNKFDQFMKDHSIPSITLTQHIQSMRKSLFNRNFNTYSYIIQYIDSLLNSINEYELVYDTKVNESKLKFKPEISSMFSAMRLTLKKLLKYVNEHKSLFSQYTLGHLVEFDHTEQTVKKTINELINLINELEDGHEHKDSLNKMLKNINKDLAILKQYKQQFLKTNTNNSKSDKNQKELAFYEEFIKSRFQKLVLKFEKKIRSIENKKDVLESFSTLHSNASLDVYDFISRSSRPETIQASIIFFLTNSIAKALSTASSNLAVNIWNSILYKTLHYSGVEDPHYGVIHRGEPSQTVFFNKADLEVLHIFHNKQSSRSNMITTLSQLKQLPMNEISKIFKKTRLLPVIKDEMRVNNINPNLIYRDSEALYYIINTLNVTSIQELTHRSWLRVLVANMPVSVKILKKTHSELF